MKCDGSFHIGGEVIGHSSGGTLRKKRNCFLDGSVGRLERVQNGDRPRVGFNDDLLTCADAVHQPGKITGRFCLGDMESRHMHDDTAI